MPRLLLLHSWVNHPGLSKAGPGVGEKGNLVGFQRKAIVASTANIAATVRLLQYSASAVTNYLLSAIRQSISKPCIQFATFICGHPLAGRAFLVNA